MEAAKFCIGSSFMYKLHAITCFQEEILKEISPLDEKT
jgi:hypothetical protein